MSIDYQGMCELYNTIIHEIFKCIEEDSPSYWDGETNRMVYSKEYLHAYSYLQRAMWRLNDTVEMEPYYAEDDFKHYGLENLSDVRYRIEGYLEDTTKRFQDNCYEYNQYDTIINEYKTVIKKSDNHRVLFGKYRELHHRMVQLKLIDSEIKMLQSSADLLKRKMIKCKFIDDDDSMFDVVDNIISLASELQVEF